jgi:hypothetical protein
MFLQLGVLLLFEIRFVVITVKIPVIIIIIIIIIIKNTKNPHPRSPVCPVYPSLHALVYSTHERETNEEDVRIEYTPPCTLFWQALRRAEERKKRKTPPLITCSCFFLIPIELTRVVALLYTHTSSGHITYHSPAQYSIV